jgi:hypothetical protein
MPKPRTIALRCALVPWVAFALCLGGKAWAGPLTGVEAGMSEFELFDGVSFGPVAGAAAVADTRGRVDGRLTLGFGVVSFHAVSPRVWKYPAWDFGLELGYQPRSAHFDTRFYVGRGIGPLTLGGSVMLAAPLRGADPPTVGFALGPELVLHLRTSQRSHTHVVQPFLRADVFVVNTREYPTQAVGGLRFLF